MVTAGRAVLVDVIVNVRNGVLCLLALSAACASHAPAPSVEIPTPESGRIRAAAVATKSVGAVLPIAVAVTNGRETTMRLDTRQIYAHGEGNDRTAPLVPAEAARMAGGRSVPGAVKRGAVGAATGSVLGAAGGAISGAIQGGIGLATAAGSAVGAFFGLIGGVLSGGGSEPDVAGFESRALRDTTVPPQFSASGYVYFPARAYRTVEILLTDDTGQVETIVTPLEMRD